jgi:tetratricopeptide (TPR) repeat protein
MELAFMQHAAGDFDAALAHCEAALEEFPHDPRPYLTMATFFRREGLPEEAIEVLEAGQSTLDEGRPDVRLWQELGLAHADAGHDDKACEFLERAVDYLVTRHHLDLPPEGAVRLAQLYEKTKRAGRALDLYTLLTKGSDRPNLFAYHLEAARLMQELGFAKDARRTLQRASELASDESARTLVTDKLAALDAGA